MPEADDYAETPLQPDMPGGVRAAERVQVIGWLGVFLAVAVAATAAIVVLTAGGRARAWVGAGLGVTALAFVAAGSYLVSIGFQERPRHGTLPMMANLVIVGPILVGFAGVHLAPLVFMVYEGVTQGLPSAVWFISILYFGFHAVCLAGAAKNRTRLRASLFEWLDPTAP